jgi:hypothetical protein
VRPPATRWPANSSSGRAARRPSSRALLDNRSAAARSRQAAGGSQAPRIAACRIAAAGMPARRSRADRGMAAAGSRVVRRLAPDIRPAASNRAADSSDSPAVADSWGRRTRAVGCTPGAVCRWAARLAAAPRVGRAAPATARSRAPRSRRLPAPTPRCWSRMMPFGLRPRPDLSC